MLWILLFAIAPPTVRSTDAEGEPLPPGAVMRLGSVRWVMEPRPGSGILAVFTPDGREVLYWGDSGRVQCRSITTGRSRTLPDLGRVMEMAFRPDGKQLTVLSWVEDHTPARERKTYRYQIQKYDWPELRPGRFRFLQTPVGDGRPQLSPDGGLLVRVLASEKRGERSGRPLRIESALNGNDFWEHDQGTGGSFLSWLAGGTGIALSSRGMLHIHEGATYRRRCSIPLPADWPKAADVPQVCGGETLFMESGGIVLRVSLAQRKVTHRASFPVRGTLAISPDGKRLVRCADGQVQQLDPETLRVRATLPFRVSGEARLIGWSPDSTALLVSDHAVLHVLDAATGRKLNRRNGHEATVWAMAFSTDGERIATGDVLGGVRVWDRTGRSLASWRHPQWVASLAFDAEAKRLAVGGLNAEGQAIVQIRDPMRGRLLSAFDAHLDMVSTLGFLPDGEQIVTGGGDSRLRWWKIATGQRLTQMKYLDDPLLLKQEGNRVLVGTRDGGLAWCGADGSTEWIATEEWGRVPLLLRKMGNRIFMRRVIPFLNEQLMWYDLKTGKWSIVPKPKGESGGEPHQVFEILAADVQLIHIPTETGRELWLHDPLDRVNLCQLPWSQDEKPWLSSPDGRWLAFREATSVLLFDIRQLRAERLLAGWLDDPKSERLLIERHPKGIAALWTKLHRAAQVERDALSHIAPLGDENFEHREAAERSLRTLGALAAPVLIAAAKGDRDPEVRNRCRRLLNALPPGERERWGEPERLRALLRFLRDERAAGGEALWDEIVKVFPDSLIRRSVLAEVKEKRP